MDFSTMHERPMIDVGSVLDHGPFSAAQKQIVALAAVSVIFDGLGSQLIGFAIPRMASEWHVPLGAFAAAVSAGLFGMSCGSACAGMLADRLGRRWAIIGSVLLFGLATCAVSLANSPASVGWFRFFAGFGIGGALPVSTTLVAEFTPSRLRPFAVTSTIVCVPLGGMLAGVFAAYILPNYGWRTLFFVGGAIPLLLCVVLLFALPESPRFLVRHPSRWDELSALLAKIHRPTAPGSRFCDRTESDVRGRFLDLFSRHYLRDSLALWCAFLLCLFTVYTAFSWLPSLLVSSGLKAGNASLALTLYNAGGVIGALLCAWAISRFGSRWPLIACSGAAAVAALLASQLQPDHHASLLLAGIAAHGLFVNAVQSTMFALCAHVYPTAIRARGAASAVAFGRLGAILSGAAGAVVLSSGSMAYFLTLGTAMLLVLVALAVVRRHIPAPIAEKRQPEAAQER
jgi:AAHS family 4-hydroxybenzoate transporter-like MFS transporter